MFKLFSKSAFSFFSTFICSLIFIFTSKTFSQTALQFDGTNDYVTFGTASALGTSMFTLECWIYKTGTGATTSTGTGGVTAVPIITKGRGEAESPANLNMNYFLGLTSAGVLTADFEDKTNGGNHPITGTTVLSNNVWYHIAASYDGTTWRIFLNGNSEATLSVGSFLPENTSIQHAGIGTAMTSTGGAAGFFAGRIDEVRIWNIVRTQTEIQASIGQEITSGTGLLARWGLNEGSGTTSLNSIAGSPNGTLTNSPTWVTGIPFTVETWGLQFNGTNNYVTFGTAVGLATQTFTIETWFKRTGTGSAKSTGSNGVILIPLVAKGSPEADGSTVDANYILGIRSSDNVLAADFEEGTGSLIPGDNHPIAGTTPILNDIWYHAAITYGNNQFKLYLNGILEASLTLPVTIWPQGNTSQHSALGTMLTSTGATNGGGSTAFFQGVLDETRIWNYARTEAEIQSTSNSKITSSQPGLLARWSLDEGLGTSVNGSAGTTFNGTIQNTGYTWVLGAPYNLSFIPPNNPSGLIANSGTGNQIQLSWTDGSNDEQGFQIERSQIGAGGPFTAVGTAVANSVSYSDINLQPNTTYYYRIRAYKGGLFSAYTNVANATTPAETNNALKFLGIDSYARINDAGGLGLTNFTIETWFYKEGPGIPSSTTGTGGLTNVIPLITKGSAEVEDSTKDINYFLCISSDNYLAADFECPNATPAGLNFPLTSSGLIQNNQWYHAAFTYDGTTMRLFLDGVEVGSRTVGFRPAAWTNSPVALGSNLQSTGNINATYSGYFQGVMDEVRIWNFAKTQTEIQSSINSKINSTQTGLIARWGLDEGFGTTISGSAGTTFNGSILNTYYQWVSGAPFNASISPSAPILVYPANGEQGLTSFPTLTTTVSDNNSTNLTVRFFGREAELPFKLIGLPDTQNYSAGLSGGTPAIFSNQTSWIRNNMLDQRIVYVAHLGDIVNTASIEQEWINANTSLSILEPSLLGYPDGVPYGTAIGNHDQIGGTTLYNNYFGISRFSGRSYYGGSYGSDNNNHYDLFSVNGMNFIVVYIRSEATAAEIAWADGIISANLSRRAILVSHNMLNTGDPAAFTSQGQAIYDAVKDNPNLFLMLCGHSAGEGKRTDTFNGNTIYSLLSDYQNYTNGGNGYLRIMEFRPSSNQISVQTYSTTLNQYEIDASSQFILPYTMSGAGDVPYVLLSTSTVPNNGNASYTWNNLAGGKTYEWYVTITDQDGNITTGPTWTFSTEESLPVELSTFAAKVISNKVHLNWETITEANNFGFEVERKADKSDNNNWKKIGFINGSGNSNSPKNYSFIDPDPIGGHKFHYRLKQIDNDGKFEYSNIIEATLLPNEYELYQNYPNPFNPSTKIKFSLPKAGKVSLKIYDLTGAIISELINTDYEAGYYDVELNSSVLGLASGIYFYQLKSGDFIKTNKMILMK